MPKIFPFKMNFTSGEISPKLHARVDLGQYGGGVETMTNFLPYPHGGCYYRPGFHYVDEVYDSSKQHRLIPFQFSREQAYVLEFGDNTIRFYKDRGIILGEDLGVDNPGFETAGGGGADVFANWTESAGDGAIADGGDEAHKGDACCKLTSGATSNTYIYSANVDVSGMAESDSFSVKFWTKGDGTYSGHYRIYDVTNTTWLCDKTSCGVTEAIWTQITYTDTIPASCNDIAIYFYCPTTSGGYAYFDSVQLLDNTEEVILTSPYGEEDLAELQWTQSADVLYLCHPDYEPYKLLRYSHEDWEIEAIDFTGPNVLVNGDFAADAVWTKGTGWTISAGVATAAAGTASNLTQVDVLEVGKEYTVTFTVQNYSAGSVTPYCGSSGTGTARSSNGTFTETITCSGSDDFYLYKNAAGAFDIDDVVVSANPFYADKDHPRTVTFHEERLFFAGSDNYPQKVWGSASGDYENMTSGADDDDAVEYTIASDTVNVIQWIVPSSALLIGTAGGEFRMKGGADDIITPSSVQVKSVSTVGSAENIKAIRIGHLILYVQTAGKKLMEMKYSFEQDSFVSQNLMLISEHLTANASIVQVVYQQEPDSTLWLLLDDGTLLSCTYETNQQVVAWAKHEVAGTDAEVESICVIPTPDGGSDDLWAIISLTIDGSTVRYVEYLDQNINGLDHAIYWSGSPATTFTGADHLEGETVGLKGDGALYPDETVSSGQFTVDESASTMWAGLQFTGTIKTLRPAVDMGGGNAYGLFKSYNQVKLMLYQSVGGNINGETLLLVDPDQLMGEAPTAFTGLLSLNVIGWDEDAQITITCDEPFPFILLAITGSLTIADEM